MKFEYKIPGSTDRATLRRASTNHETVLRVLDAQRKVIAELRVQPVVVPVSGEVRGGQSEASAVMLLPNDAMYVEVEGERGDQIRFERV